MHVFGDVVILMNNEVNFVFNFHGGLDSNVAGSLVLRGPYDLGLAKQE